MAKIVVFGASGKAGREIAAVAESRGHEVTRIGRTPGVQAAAEVAAGHDVAVSSVADLSRDPAEFYTEAANALVASGVPRIIVIGIYTLLETSPGVRVIDSPDFPAEHKPFCLGHAAGIEVLANSTANWLVMSPAGMFGGTSPDTSPAISPAISPGISTGSYRLTPVNPADELTYEAFALAVVDEIDHPTHHPTHHHTQLGVSSA